MPRIAQSPTDPAFVQNPYPFYDRMRALGPLLHWDDYDLPCAVSHAAVNAILRDRRFGRERPDRSPPPDHLRPFYAIDDHSMLELEPPRHTRLRGLVLRAFTARRIAGLEPEIAALAQALIDRFPEGPVDLLPAFAQQIPVIVIARLLGVPEAMKDQLLDWSHAMVAMYQAGRTRAVEDRAASAARDFADFLRGHVEARRARPADDLITHLIAARDAGAQLSTDELIATCVLLLNAGHEATVHAIANGIKVLLEAGGPRDWLSPGRLDATVEEILRVDPPLHLFTRIAYEEVEVMGRRIAAGTEVTCLLAAAGRDPRHWEAPHRFDPGRMAKPHLAFGAGLHFCLGAPLARLEMRTALPILFARRPGLRLVGRPEYADSYHFHGLTALRVEG
ncbi:cytochrome P450 [Pararhodobacter sp. SW119]|uniref:cytochrome P450 n=1 Tax=Pararhodobacter sp. SW119 TaxID=2780075 RepID=UPI001ADF8040|nr:cytochrome P450 [Pararhodobacter sp. SW119]